MRILGICGSPRLGNSKFLLEKSVEAAARNAADVQTDYFFFHGKKINPCVGCLQCVSRSECVLKDDFQELSRLWLRADIIIYSAPVYHMGLPGQLKCFIDRLGQSWGGTVAKLYPDDPDVCPRLLKVVGCLTQGMHQAAGQENVMMALINHAIIMQCIPVAGDYWQSYLGSGGWTHHNEDKFALETLWAAGDFSASAAVVAAEQVGKRCAQTASIIRQGMKNLPEKLQNDVDYDFYYSKDKFFEGRSTHE